MRYRIRTPREFEKELHAAAVAGELRLDRAYVVLGAAASDLLARWLDEGEDVRQVASDWNAAIRQFRVTYRFAGIPVLSVKKRPIVISREAGR